MALQTIGSCCNCGKNTYHWDALTLSPGTIRNGSVVDTIKTNILSKDSLGLLLNLHAVYDAMLWDQLPQCQTAVACKCGWVIKDMVRSVQCTSLQAWDSTYPAGSDITGLLEARSLKSDNRGEETGTAFCPLTDVAELFNRRSFLYARPATKTVIPSVQQLAVTVTMEGGRKISAALTFALQ